MKHNKVVLSLVAIGLIGFCCIGFLISSIGSKSISKGDNSWNGGESGNNGPPCNTSGCLRMSDYLQSSLDYRIKPCDDFYEFVCGKALERKQEDPSEIISSFIEVYAQVNDEIRMLLEHTNKFPTGKSANLMRLRNHYFSCSNEQYLDSLGNKPLMELIRSVGGFPILGEPSGWLPGNEKKISWADRLVKYRSLGAEHDFLFSLNIQANPANNSLAEIYLDKPMPNNEDIMIEMGGAALRAIEFGITVSRLVNLGASGLTAATYHVPKIYGLKDRLNKLRESIGDEYTSIKMSEFCMLGLSVDIRNLINQVMGSELSPDQTVLVNLEFLRALDETLLDSDPKVVANYMLYRLVQDLAKYLDQSWGLQPRDCIAVVQNELDVALGHEYVKHFVSNESRNAVMTLVDKIRTQTKVNIDEADWILGSTRQIAKDKVDAIRSIVAYPDQLINETFIEQLMSSTSVKINDYFGNHLRITRSNWDYEYSQLNVDQRDNYWQVFTQTTVTNAMYAPMFNSINIMAGIMLGRIFDRTSPHYLNFAAIGSIIGHEITHAFDPHGSEFDKLGNKLPNGTWWNSETMVGYERNKKCFVQAYDGLPSPSNPRVKIDGNFTLGENIADNGGIQVAYEAYKLWVSEQGIEQEPLLPGVNFNQDQMFWVGLAATWCDVIDPEMAAILAKMDVHSPNKYRINVPFANSKAFSDSFNCPKGSSMNRPDKCVVW